MSEFDYLSVLLSIIFGIGLTHTLSGLFRLVYRRRLTEMHLLYTGWVLMVLVLQWWVLYSWRDYPSWSFETFLLLVVWALSFYVLAIALYPPEEIDTGDSPFRYRWFHAAARHRLVVLRIDTRVGAGRPTIHQLEPAQGCVASRRDVTWPRRTGGRPGRPAIVSASGRA